MKKLIISMFLVIALVAVNVGIAAAAADVAKKAPSAAQLAQQEKMKTCNKEAAAKALKGDERKAFMKNCLSGKTSTAPVTVAPATAPAATKVTQQDKMKACNKDAKEKALKGDKRKKFMSECLSKNF
jgi:DNA-binding protein YbaB